MLVAVLGGSSKADELKFCGDGMIDAIADNFGLFFIDVPLDRYNGHAEPGYAVFAYKYDGTDAIGVTIFGNYANDGSAQTAFYGTVTGLSNDGESYFIRFTGFCPDRNDPLAN